MQSFELFELQQDENDCGKRRSIVILILNQKIYYNSGSSWDIRHHKINLSSLRGLGILFVLIRPGPRLLLFQISLPLS